MIRIEGAQMQECGLNGKRAALSRAMVTTLSWGGALSPKRAFIVTGLMITLVASSIPASIAGNDSSAERGGVHRSAFVVVRSEPCSEPEYRPERDEPLSAVASLIGIFLLGLGIGLYALPRVKPPPPKDDVKKAVEDAFKERIEEAKAHLLPGLDKMLDRAKAEVLAALKKLELVN
jgi:hypothetical protein